MIRALLKAWTDFASPQDLSRLSPQDIDRVHKVFMAGAVATVGIMDEAMFECQRTGDLKKATETISALRREAYEFRDALIAESAAPGTPS
jgi:hypothetical protein